MGTARIMLGYALPPGCQAISSVLYALLVSVRPCPLFREKKALIAALNVAETEVNLWGVLKDTIKRPTKRHEF